MQVQMLAVNQVKHGFQHGCCTMQAVAVSTEQAQVALTYLSSKWAHIYKALHILKRQDLLMDTDSC